MATKRTVAAKVVAAKPAMVEHTVEVVKLSSSVEGGMCNVCGGGFGSNEYYPDLERQVNHYLAHPGCTLLHVGQETSPDVDGHPWQSTVAIISVPHTNAPSKYR